jgi:hypothetical protein
MKILIFLVAFLLPVIPVYLFFPDTNLWDKCEIELDMTLAIGGVVSIIFWCCLFIIIMIATVFPLLALLIIGGIFVVIKKNYKKWINEGLDNYVRVHGKKEDSNEN